MSPSVGPISRPRPRRTSRLAERWAGRAQGRCGVLSLYTGPASHRRFDRL